MGVIKDLEKLGLDENEARDWFKKVGGKVKEEQKYTRERT